MESKQQAIVKWRLLLELEPEVGDFIANDFRVIAEGSDQKVWNLSEYDNPNEIYLLYIEDSYWIVQLESRSTI